MPTARYAGLVQMNMSVNPLYTAHLTYGTGNNMTGVEMFLVQDRTKLGDMASYYLRGETFYYPVLKGSTKQYTIINTGTASTPGQSSANNQAIIRNGILIGYWHTDANDTVQILTQPLLPGTPSTLTNVTYPYQAPANSLWVTGVASDTYSIVDTVDGTVWNGIGLLTETGSSTKHIRIHSATNSALANNFVLTFTQAVGTPIVNLQLLPFGGLNYVYSDSGNTADSTLSKFTFDRTGSATSFGADLLFLAPNPGNAYPQSPLIGRAMPSPNMNFGGVPGTWIAYQASPYNDGVISGEVFALVAFDWSFYYLVMPVGAALGVSGLANGAKFNSEGFFVGNDLVSGNVMFSDLTFQQATSSMTPQIYGSNNLHPIQWPCTMCGRVKSKV